MDYKRIKEIADEMELHEKAILKHGRSLQELKDELRRLCGEDKADQPSRRTITAFLPSILHVRVSKDDARSPIASDTRGSKILSFMAQRSDGLASTTDLVAAVLGKQPENRVEYRNASAAISYLAREDVGLLRNVKRGTWALTTKGIELLKGINENPVTTGYEETPKQEVAQ